jgi:hypothetical protein
MPRNPFIMSKVAKIAYPAKLVQRKQRWIGTIQQIQTGKIQPNRIGKTLLHRTGRIVLKHSG